MTLSLMQSKATFSSFDRSARVSLHPQDFVGVLPQPKASYKQSIHAVDMQSNYMSQLACLPFFLTQALDAAMQGPAFHEFTDKVRQVGSHSMLPSIREHKQELLLLSPSTHGYIQISSL